MKRICLVLSGVLALGFLLAPISGLASFSGRWSGSGGVSFGPGNNLDCGVVRLGVEQGFRYFEIQRAEAFCQNRQYRFPTGLLEVDNGVLKDRGYAVGRIGFDFFYVIWSPSPGVLDILDARMDAKGVLTFSHTESVNGSGTAEMRATLVSNEMSHLE